MKRIQFQSLCRGQLTSVALALRPAAKADADLLRFALVPTERLVLALRRAKQTQPKQTILLRKQLKQTVLLRSLLRSKPLVPLTLPLSLQKRAKLLKLLLKTVRVSRALARHSTATAASLGTDQQHLRNQLVNGQAQ
jgi:hypothetical protein